MLHFEPSERRQEVLAQKARLLGTIGRCQNRTKRLHKEQEYLASHGESMMDYGREAEIREELTDLGRKTCAAIQELYTIDPGLVCRSGR